MPDLVALAKREPRERVADGLLAAGSTAVLAPSAVNVGHGLLVRAQMRRAIGNKGGLDQQGRPVRPSDLPQQRQPHAAGRGASPASQAAHRYEQAAKPYLARLAKKPAGTRARAVGGAVGLPLLIGSAVVGAPRRRKGEQQASEVGKAEDFLAVSPQNGFGIPPTRGQVLSPLAMYASGNIMLGAMASAQGKRNWPTPTRRRRRKAAYQFAGGLGMLYSPLGAGARVTG